MLFEVFHRYDALDYISPWEQKIYSKILFDKELAESKKILDFLNQKYGKYKMLAAHCLFTDLFWRHKKKKINWLEKEIRL
ncbi:MAG: hypothetical protein AUJ50_02510 [Candidatus Aenigmarchaeota archaeon CG1_02_38_14]|nr:MAG: hypothetical protein AUJ50_02510 [Candidatus Aenigmarchaeota archaeon CG1_02_38_14]